METKKNIMLLTSAVFALALFLSECSFFSNLSATESYKIGTGLEMLIGLGVMLVIMTTVLLAWWPKVYLKGLKSQFLMIAVAVLAMAGYVHFQKNNLVTSDFELAGANLEVRR